MEFTFDWAWQQVLAFFALIWSYWEVKFILGHIALNVVAAIATSIYTNEFLLGKLGQFLYRKVLPYILLFAAFAAFGEATNLGGMTTVAFAGIEAMLAADLFDNLKKIGLKRANGGNPALPDDNAPRSPVPDWLTK